MCTLLLVSEISSTKSLGQYTYELFILNCKNFSSWRLVHCEMQVHSLPKVPRKSGLDQWSFNRGSSIWILSISWIRYWQILFAAKQIKTNIRCGQGRDVATMIVTNHGRTKERYIGWNWFFHFIRGKAMNFMSIATLFSFLKKYTDLCLQ